MSLKMRSNIMLFITALIWGTAFVAQKSGMDYVEPFTFNGIRTLIGAVVLTPVIIVMDRQKKSSAASPDGSSAYVEDEARANGGRKWLLLGGLCCGTVLFIGGSLQQVALQTTSAGKAGFITALYIVLVPVLGLFMKKKVRPIVWFCVAASAVGLFLLCVPKGEHLSGIGFGEVLLFISSVWFAVHILVIDYFVEKGHKKIGFIGRSDRNIDTGKPSMDIREWSFRQSVAYYHCLEEEYILISEKFTVDEGYRMGKELLKKSSLPTALCIASDTLAVGVLQALNEKGIQVPEQMALFSINDVNIAKYLSPPLTTIHIDIPCICETALDLLRNRVLYGGKVTKLIFVNGIPIFRKSC